MEPGEINLPHVANQEQPAELPHVANPDAPKVVLEFATRGKSGKGLKPAKSTNKLATRGKSQTGSNGKSKLATRGKNQSRPPVVDDVKTSKGMWAFRLRWNSLPGRPVHYVRRVTDAVHDLIREDEDSYEQFKAQLISSYSETSIFAGGNAG